MEIILAGKSLSAEEALGRGIVSKVIPNDADLVEELLKLAEKIVDKRKLSLSKDHYEFKS